MGARKILSLIFLIILTFPVFSQGAQEMQQIVDNTVSDDVQEVMKSIYFLESKIEEIEKRYETLFQEKNYQIEQSYTVFLEQQDSQKPEIWETDAEFRSRLGKEREAIRKEMENEMRLIRVSVMEQRDAEANIYEQWLADAYENLNTPRILEKSSIMLEALEYQRNERKWPISISSIHPLVPFEDLEVVIDFENLLEIIDYSRDIRQEIVDLDSAIRDGKLSSEVVWNAYRDEKNSRFVLGVAEVRIVNELNGISYHFSYPELLLMSAYKIVKTNEGIFELQRVGVITDIEPLIQPIEGVENFIRLPSDISSFILCDIITLPSDIVPTFFTISPANAFDKSLTMLISNPKASRLEYKMDMYYFVFDENMSFKIFAENGLFEETFELVTENIIAEQGIIRQENHSPDIVEVLDTATDIDKNKMTSSSQNLGEHLTIKEVNVRSGIGLSYSPNAISINIHLIFKNIRGFYNTGITFDLNTNIEAGFLFENYFSFWGGEIQVRFGFTGLSIDTIINTSTSTDLKSIVTFSVPLFISCYITSLSSEFFFLTNVGIRRIDSIDSKFVNILGSSFEIKIGYLYTLASAFFNTQTRNTVF